MLALTSISTSTSTGIFSAAKLRILRLPFLAQDEVVHAQPGDGAIVPPEHLRVHPDQRDVAAEHHLLRWQHGDDGGGGQKQAGSAVHDGSSRKDSRSGSVQRLDYW
jgi:hypothetical protein